MGDTDEASGSQLQVPGFGQATPSCCGLWGGVNQHMEDSLSASCVLVT